MHILYDYMDPSGHFSSRRLLEKLLEEVHAGGPQIMILPCVLPPPCLHQSVFGVRLRATCNNTQYWDPPCTLKCPQVGVDRPEQWVFRVE